MYAFRLLWYEGVGGADLEWFSVDRTTLGTSNVVRTLINAPNAANAVKAYRSRIGVPVNQPKATVLHYTTTGDNLVLSFLTEAGFSYTLESNDALNSTTWQSPLPTVAGDGTTKTLSQPIQSGSRFYRLRIQ